MAAATGRVASHPDRQVYQLPLAEPWVVVDVVS